MAGPRHDPTLYRDRDTVPIRRALVSVSDKTDLLVLAAALAEAGVEGSEYLPRGVFFQGDRENVYGASYGTTPMSALWREYARAHKRRGGSDITVISLELLTVFVAGPLAVWICCCIKKNRSDASFWMVVLATGELYGGWMTFVPVRQIHCAVLGGFTDLC